ncbi:MAG: hypothetical protein H0U74_06985 [Bradymonadaceae bacterium]|nr:hypothetical protein [Lujinxingiaceae bacterium]
MPVAKRDKESVEKARSEHVRRGLRRETERGAAQREAYLGEAGRLVPSIMAFGLGQACAGMLFEAAGRHGHPGYILYDDLQSWLCRRDERAPYRGETVLLDAIMRREQEQYVQAHGEARAWLDELLRIGHTELASLPKP